MSDPTPGCRELVSYKYTQVNKPKVILPFQIDQFCATAHYSFSVTRCSWRPRFVFLTPKSKARCK